MKILFFMENYHCGGLDTFLITLLKNWPNKSDHLIVVCNKDHPGIPKIKESLAPKVEVYSHDILLAKDFSDKVDAIPFLKYIRKIFSPFIRYSFIFKEMGGILKLFKKFNPDKLMVVNGGYPGGDSCRAASICWKYFFKKGSSVHNFHNMVTSPRWFESIPEKVIDGLLTKSCHQFITVSKSCMSSMRERPLIFNSKKVAHIWNGIEGTTSSDITPINLKKELSLPDNAKLCLMMGTYEPRKGHAYMFKAFKKVLKENPNSYLAVYGFGYDHEKRNVEELVTKFGLKKNVFLQGFISNPFEIINSVDLVLVPSQSFESFGLVSVEAMSQQVPVVATNVGGIPEVVVNGDGGFCVSKNSPEEFADRIIQLLKSDELRKEQGVKGKARFEKYFTAKRMALEYEKLIKGGELSSQ